MRALLCIGRLVSLTLAKPGKTIRLKNKWLAWDGRNLHICTVTGTTKALLPASLAKKHATFHNAPPQGNPFTAECPKPSKGAQQLGLVKGLVYTVPRKIDSPEKNPYLWHHAFGDTGHEGGAYPEKVMPALLKDAKGNLFFKRRRGNIYRVDQWLRG